MLRQLGKGACSQRRRLLFRHRLERRRELRGRLVERLERRRELRGLQVGVAEGGGDLHLEDEEHG